ncbi:MAG TPA: hypothetical protein VE981_00535 [Planctomycetota bacterium]|nr:hypothetical protein [Planctomycetota bacterium]
MRITAVLILAFAGPATLRADSAWKREIVDLTRLDVLHTVVKRYTHSIAPAGSAFAVFDTNVVRLIDPRDGREIQTLTGHGGLIHDSGWSRDGRLVATSGYDETLRVWESATGKQLLNVKPLASFACSVAISPDSKSVAAGSSDDGKLVVVDIATGKSRSFQTPDKILFAVDFTPDGRQLLVNHVIQNPADTSLRVYNVADFTEVKIPVKGHVGSYAVSPDGRTLAWSNPQGSIVLLETTGWTELRRFDGHLLGATSLAFHPCGRYLASSGRDGAVRLWNVESAKEINSLPIKGEVDSRIAFGSDGATLVVATADATVKVYGHREPVSGASRPAPELPKIEAPAPGK